MMETVDSVRATEGSAQTRSAKRTQPGANTDLEMLHRNGLMLDDIVRISNRCTSKGIDFILGGGMNMVVRERDVGTVSPECLDLMDGFSTATGLQSSFVGRFPDLEDRRSAYTYSWQGEGRSLSVIDHLSGFWRRAFLTRTVGWTQITISFFVTTR